jgi:transposase
MNSPTMEGAAVRALLPKKARGMAHVDDRRVVNGIFWILHLCQIPFGDEK